MMSDSYETRESSRASRLAELSALYNLLKAFAIATVASIPVFFKWILHLVAPPPPKNVTGQLALVTGGSAGIGLAIAQNLAKAGCNIAIVSRTLAMGQRVAAEISSKYKVKASAFQADVANRSDVARLKREVEATLGTVDILVNNAGLLSLEHSLLEGDDDEYQRVVDTNLTSYFWTTREFLPGMKERRRGHIVAVSSLITKSSTFGLTAYIATKHGNIGFMEGLHEDLLFFGFGDCIKTTTVLPSYVATQKKLTDLIESAGKVQMANVDDVGRDIVAGVLRNRRSFVVPQSHGLLGLFSWFPDAAAHAGKMSLVRREVVEEILATRAKQKTK